MKKITKIAIISIAVVKTSTLRNRNINLEIFFIHSFMEHLL